MAQMGQSYNASDLYRSYWDSISSRIPIWEQAVIILL